jgi:hypothetical protein
MRTTLTLDDDVAAEIESVRRDKDASLRDVVNEVLRLGLREMRGPAKQPRPFRTEPIKGTTPVLSNMDNIAEVMALAEDEMFG